MFSMVRRSGGINYVDRRLAIWINDSDRVYDYRASVADPPSQQAHDVAQAEEQKRSQSDIIPNTRGSGRNKMIENIVAVVIGILLPVVVFCYILLFGMGAAWSVTREEDDE